MPGRVTGRRRRGDVLSQWAAKLPESYLLCRDLGHVWQPFRASYDKAANGYRRTLRCSRCKTERSQILNLDGVVRSGYYAYDDDYRAPAGTGNLDRNGRGTLRLESTLRLIETDDGSE